MRLRPLARGIALIAMMLLVACERGARSMYVQPKNVPYSYSRLFSGGQSARPMVPNTIPAAGDDFAGTSSGRVGVLTIPPTLPVVTPVLTKGNSAPLRWPPSLADIPVEVTGDLMRRGRERYNIYCAPCHGLSGNGKGQIVQRGYPAPETLHSDRLRGANDAFFYAVITRGYGIMFPYASYLRPNDRWAIVAYIRALQLSRHAPASMVPPARLRNLRPEGDS